MSVFWPRFPKAGYLGAPVSEPPVEVSSLPEVLSVEELARVLKETVSWCEGRRYTLPCLIDEDGVMSVRREDVPRWLRARFPDLEYRGEAPGMTERIESERERLQSKYPGSTSRHGVVESAADGSFAGVKWSR